MTSAVLVEADGPILTITLNRPEVRNAINLEVCKGVAGAIDRLENDRHLRVGVLTGAGSVFCSGADLRAADAGDSLAINNFEPGGFAGFALYERRKPVIGAAQGLRWPGASKSCSHAKSWWRPIMQCLACRKFVSGSWRPREA